MGAASEVEQEERRRKPWMRIEVRGGGGGFLVLGGALIAAGLGAAFTVYQTHLNNKRSRSATMRPVDEVCKVAENLDKGISCNGEGGQLDEVDGDAERGPASLLALDPILPAPTIKLAEDWQGEFLVQSPVETQENMANIMIDQSPSFKHLDDKVATEVRIMKTDAADGGDSVAQEILLGGPESSAVPNQKGQSSEESEFVTLEELKEEFSFSVVEFTEIQEKINENLEESGLDCVKDHEEKDDREDGEDPSSEEVEEFSFRAVESDTIQNQTKQTLEESKITHVREQEGGRGGGGEERNDDGGAPSSESQEDETESSAKGESEREEEGSDATGAPSIKSSAEVVWPAEVIEQEKGSLFLENHQKIEEEGSEEKVTAMQAQKETEKYEEKFVEKITAAIESVGKKMGEVAAEIESVGKKMGAGLETMKRETKFGLMPVNYSNRFLLLLLALALALSLNLFRAS